MASVAAEPPSVAGRSVSGCRSGLVISVPGERILGADDAGAVHFLHGGEGGLTTSGAQWIDQNVAGRIPHVWDRFGSSVAAGDFDGDGCPDLAVGVPYEFVNGALAAGEVDVLYGSVDGLLSGRSQAIDQAMLGLATEERDYFGGVLAVGDFDGDGYDDLAVGVENEDVGTVSSAGGFNVIYGGPGGLTAVGSQWFDQGILGLSVESFDHFGSALAAGDFDGDGRDDLAAGAYGEDLLGPPETMDAGGFSVVYGSPTGLSVDGRQWFEQSVLGLFVEQGDQFGRHLAVGDLDGDHHDDLVVGVPSEDVSSVSNAGGVSVVYGGPGGLAAAGSQWFDQSTLGLGTGAEDQFGSAVACGDLNGDGYDDLAVGVRFEDVGSYPGVRDAGEVDLLYGGPTGITLAGSTHLDQSSLGLALEEGDGFGWSLGIGDLDWDGYDDLVIGVPDEDIGTVTDAGGAHVLYGGPSGISTLGSQWLDQQIPNLGADPDPGDFFGSGLVVLGSPRIFRDGFESGDWHAWSKTSALP